LSLDSVFTVSSLGAGPGLYFDFAGFIFQVPDIWSADSTATLRATSRSAAAKTATCLVRMNTSSKSLVRPSRPKRQERCGKRRQVQPVVRRAASMEERHGYTSAHRFFLTFR